MPIRRLRPFLTLVPFVAIVTVALACGPDFHTILAKRHVELAKAVQGNFFYDASHLVARPAKPFPGDSISDADTDTEKKAAVVAAAHEGLSATQIAAVNRMRAAADGDAAYAIGTGLPEAVRAYTAAAVDYHLAQHGVDCIASADPKKPNPDCRKQEVLQAAALQHAVNRFEHVLQLPPDNRKLRATWAAYSLGLAYGLSGDLYSPSAVDKYFELVRQLAQQANPDPQHLALDSLGAQALIHLNEGGIARAMELYAEQAANGSMGGVMSLSLVTQQLLHEPALLRQHIPSVVVQKAVIAFVLAYGNDAAAPGAGLPASQDPDAPVTPSSRLALVTHALEAAGVKEPAYADRLAAAAYRYGQFDMAQRYAASSNTTLALWVQAKLALRAGKTQDAAHIFSQALAQLKVEDASAAPLEDDARKRLAAESATFALTRGDFLMAFHQMYSVGNAYWSDLAYMAERVLTTDELKTYIDQHVAEFAPPPHMDKEHVQDRPTNPEHDLSARLRDLLARRLMRDGRYEQAYAYFHTDNDDRFSNPHVRDDAKRYASALLSAKSAWTSIGRAKALYQAASLARWKGMDMLGFEMGPDYFADDGNFDEELAVPDSQDMATPKEIERYQASAAKVDARYHYRYVATQLALQAAQALPSRSEAYALVLSNACSWLIDRDPEEADVAYQMYLDNGAAMQWATPFGRNPAEPNFWRAYVFQARQWGHQQTRQLRLWARRHKPVAWLLMLLAGLGLSGLAWRARKARAHRMA